MLDQIPLAAIDIGSNTFRLEIGQLRRGRYRRIKYVKRWFGSAVAWTPTAA